MTRQEHQQFRKILEAHVQTVAVADACAATTRDLAAEVARGGTLPRDDLLSTMAEAERVLADLARVREEVERLLSNFAVPQRD